MFFFSYITRWYFRRLENLRKPGLDRLYVQEQLQILPGVGRKVADCVALFSLDQAGAIPVDVHVW